MSNIPQQLQACRVSAPATSANLGVGYDCLGMALSLRASFEFRGSTELHILGCEERFRGEDNLVWQSYLYACKKFDLEPQTLEITIDSPIPLLGGLGSSSACVVAGIAAARTLHGLEADEVAVLRCGVEIEGHPDNIAPAVLGGVVSSFLVDGETISTREDVAKSLRFVAVAPQIEIRTEEARKVMPTLVPLEVAVWQMGRCMPTVQALQHGDLELLALACDDKLHEPYRKALIEPYERLRETAFDSGAAAFFISGSGSTMIAVCDSDEQATAIENAFKACENNAWTSILSASDTGFEIELI